MASESTWRRGSFLPLLFIVTLTALRRIRCTYASINSVACLSPQFNRRRSGGKTTGTRRLNPPVASSIRLPFLRRCENIRHMNVWREIQKDIIATPPRFHKFKLHRTLSSMFLPTHIIRLLFAGVATRLNVSVKLNISMQAHSTEILQ